MFCDFETGKYTFASDKSVITEVFNNILKTEHILFAFKMEDHLEKGKNTNLRIIIFLVYGGMYEI